MTTIFPVQRVCAVCGKESEHHVLGSTNMFGPSDLDMRPPPMARDTLAEQIQCCPHCGYCAGDISEASESARRVVPNDAYQAELKRNRFPELTRWYVCASLILSVADEDAQAGHVALKGAWVADDAEDREAADYCRRLAIGCLEADRRRGLTFAPDEATAAALLADLHRRVGDFPAARAYALAGIAGGAEGLVRDVLDFEVRLAEAGDPSCHNIGEIGGEEEGTIIL